MKLNIANPATGQQKLIEIDEEKILQPLYEKKMSDEVAGETLGEQYKGYVFKISGGNDKQGFPMKEGVLAQGRVRLLLGKGQSCFRERRSGTKRRKSVRGCLVGPDLSVLALVIVKKGDAELPGLTDQPVPIRLGPKRASKIRKLFALDKNADVRKYVVRRTIAAKEEGGKTRSRAPKIQRLVTPRVLERKRKRLALKKQRYAASKAAAADYEKLLKSRLAEQKAKRQAQLSKRRESKKSTKTSVKKDSVKK